MDRSEWNQYECEWQTQKGPGATFYSGTKVVWAEDEDDAQDRAQREVWRSFKEYYISHIIITSVTRMK